MTSRAQALAWYQNIYNDAKYKMGEARFKFASQELSYVLRGTYLDVGCGRGEMLNEAEALGFENVTGVDACKSIVETDARMKHGIVQCLPFSKGQFDVVTMFDVMEHLPEADILLALSELRRVVNKTLILTISNHRSIVNGIDLHITKKPYAEWDALLRDMFSSGKVKWIRNPIPCISELWRIDFE